MTGTDSGAESSSGRALAAVVLLLAAVWLAPGAGLLIVAGGALGAVRPGQAAACGPDPASFTLPPGTGAAPTATTLDAEQVANATAITQAVLAQRLPARAGVIAVATALQESSLRNIPAGRGDLDSIGLFQQRPSAGYDPAAASDPSRATVAFLARVVRIPSWGTRPLTDVAADVQRPREDLRGAYARWEPLATQLVSRLWPPESITTTAAVGTLGGMSACPDQGGEGNLAIGADAVPVTANGVVLNGGPADQQAARFAMAQLGEPYVYGANGPNAWDCSSLMQAAFASAGVAIPRTTYYQVDAGVAVPLSQARTGDLVFIPGSHGTPAQPGHVGMILGTRNGQLLIIQAPKTGDVVKIVPASNWTNLIVAVRRVG